MVNVELKVELVGYYKAKHKPSYGLKKMLVSKDSGIGTDEEHELEDDEEELFDLSEMEEQTIATMVYPPGFLLQQIRRSVRERI